MNNKKTLLTTINKIEDEAYRKVIAKSIKDDKGNVARMLIEDLVMIEPTQLHQDIDTMIMNLYFE